ncbi:MAG: hypothetical protein IJW30_02610 [Clostridia bacterium]|nr:hypothetical protein [Clostridia bacterium]
MNLRKGYFLSLGGNGSRDQWSLLEHRGPAVCQSTGRYKDTPAIDRALLYELIDALPALGIDLVVLDVLDAMQYDSHPEISLKNAFTHEEMRALLSHMREIGLEPVPKLNFSSCHDTWLKDYGKMKGTAKYYEVVKDLIDEVCEVFDRPSLFHLGMDEEDVATHKKSLTIIRCSDLWFHDLYFYMDCVEKNGVRPWIWGDYYWANAEVFKKKIPKELLISNWGYMRYWEGHARVKMQYDTYDALAELGYDQLPCGSTWCCHQNIAQIVHYFKKKELVNEHLVGFMVAPWTGVAEASRYWLLDDAHRLQAAMKMLEE